jgi:hypothetical protein
MSSSRQKVELPTHEDGELVDYLEEDPELPNQRYCIVSFISPEKVIEKFKSEAVALCETILKAV